MQKINRNGNKRKLESYSDYEGENPEFLGLRNGMGTVCQDESKLLRIGTKIPFLKAVLKSSGSEKEIGWGMCVGIPVRSFLKVKFSRGQSMVQNCHKYFSKYSQFRSNLLEKILNKNLITGRKILLKVHNGEISKKSKILTQIIFTYFAGELMKLP